MPDGLPNVPEHLLQVPAPASRWTQLADRWLIDEWRRAWRLHTVIFALAFAGLSAAEAKLDQVQALVPPKYWPYISLGFGLLMPVLRMLRQPDWRKRLEAGE